MSAIDDPRGLTVLDATLAAGETFLSDPIWIPRGCHMVSVEIQAEPNQGVPGADLVLKIRQANIPEGTLSDRGVTSPTVLVNLAAAQRTVTADDVVGHYLQVELACATEAADVLIVAGAK